jgi:hypothetical protein
MQPPVMTFEQAMAKSRELELAAWRAIALRLPDRRTAISAFIQFNPHLYLGAAGHDSSGD